MTSASPPPGAESPATPPEAWDPLLRLARVAGRPLERFLRIEAASGIVLIGATAVALLCANSPWAAAWADFWHTPLALRVGTFEFERSLEWAVNDILMGFFFFVVAMEIRREVHHGELSEWRRAALPLAAALGGMVVPALLYLAIAGAPATHSGWGVPMATDIAFAVGVLALLGKRVPAALRVLLLAVAVIDDLGAILVIALFYSSGVKLAGLIVAAAGMIVIYAMQGLAMRRKLSYLAPGIVVWAGIYAAGIHPTIAGVIVGFVTPVRAWLGREGFQLHLQRQVERLRTAESLSEHELAEVLYDVDNARREARSPAESLIEMLHPWVAFLIMPVFALANAGVSFDGLALDATSTSAAVGVAVGLAVGKPIGILLASLGALWFGLATLPRGLGPRHLLVLGVVAGIGFTMALFIAQLAFADERLLGAAKLGVLASSAVASVVGLALGAWLLRPIANRGVARTADEAEAST